MEDDELTADQLKEKGNECVQNNKFEEAILHYTRAIKIDTHNFTLYSNRSFAFFKVQQYYLAMEDAMETIKLHPAWAKGHFRKAEVEFATGHYIEACESYRRALELKPDDINLLEAVNRTVKEILKEQRADQTIPWLGAGIGIIIGVIIVIADCVFTYKPTHPMFMAIFTIAIAMLGYGLARAYRYWSKCQKTGLLSPPLDLDIFGKDDESNSTQSETKSHTPRYTKSQARQRYRKGKM